MNTKEAWRKYERSRIKAQEAYDEVVDPALYTFNTIELAAREKLEKAYERAEKVYEADMKVREAANTTRS